MSEENTVENVQPETAPKPAKEPSRHLTREQVLGLINERGLTAVQMTSFDRVGEKNDPHLTISRAQKVVRIYGHGFQLEAPGVVNFTDEQRKEKKLGGITCELDVKGSETDVSLAALGLMLDHVKAAAVSKATDAAPVAETPAEA